MSRYTKHVKNSDNFINLTNETINLYEIITGEIWSFPPSEGKLPASPHYGPEDPSIYYILDQATIEKVRQSGRSLNDIAFIYNKSYGRDNTQVAYLRWAQDPEYCVVLRHRIRLVI